MQGKIIATSVLAATLMAATAAQAQTYVVNTQTPSGALTGSISISTTSWMAESFSVSSTMSIDSIRTYLLSDDSFGDQGKTFNIALYSNVSSLPSLNFNDATQGQLFQTAATYSGDGWNGVTGLNWSIGPGTYWLAIEQYGSAQDAGSLQLATGAQPSAQGLAYYGGGQKYAIDTDVTHDTFGLQITAAVPEPSSSALALASVGVLALISRRRKA